MIIGLINIRKHDLTTVFKHIYKTEAVTDKNTVLQDRQVLIDDQSERSNQGADAEVTDALEALNDPTGSPLKVKTSCRVLLPPCLQREIVFRGGKRQNTPRRSNRL